MDDEKHSFFSNEKTIPIFSFFEEETKREEKEQTEEGRKGDLPDDQTHEGIKKEARDPEPFK